MKKFSIITPAYNSAKTLRMYLDSILSQNYDLSKVEVLILDGGSTDNTYELIDEYKSKIDVRIIHNEHRLPEYAKTIGINTAVGEYCVLQDSDEVLVNRNSFKIREEIFSKYPEVKNTVCTVYKNPDGYSPWGEYTSLIGDPFSAFVYNFGADTHIDSSKRFYKSFVEEQDFCVFKISDSDLQPLIDATGHTFDRKYFLNLLGKEQLETRDSTLISQLMISSTHSFAVTKKDEILHYSSSSFSKIINKVRARIIRNVFRDPEAGFMTRLGTMPKLYQYKRYLFLPYAFLILPALYDGIKFSIKTKNIYFVFHVVFAFYTACSICWFTLLKKMGKYQKVKVYG